ncbi:hypothetical protein I79_021589 [Cricetulus griseus]|uniref:Uncharacterized protein n=1 Tax=Cricetulus griseus TaxID=10029 RepID=G3ID26_CRIGR|nr:hypothetical protein I79_021589 [Cricetulus griseus]
MGQLRCDFEGCTLSMAPSCLILPPRTEMNSFTPVQSLHSGSLIHVKLMTRAHPATQPKSLSREPKQILLLSGVLFPRHIITAT